MGVKKTACLFRIRAAYAALHPGGVDLALEGKEMDAAMLRAPKHQTAPMLSDYLKIFEDSDSHQTAQQKNNLAQALLQTCGGCSSIQRACMMVSTAAATLARFSYESV